MRRTDARSRRPCTGSPSAFPARRGAAVRPPVHAPEPGADGDFADLDPRALEILSDCRLEPGLAEAAGEAVQFERQGYFCRDPTPSPERLVFNRTVALRDTWAKLQTKGA